MGDEGDAEDGAAPAAGPTNARLWLLTLMLAAGLLIPVVGLSSSAELRSRLHQACSPRSHASTWAGWGRSAAEAFMSDREVCEALVRAQLLAGLEDAEDFAFEFQGRDPEAVWSEVLRVIEAPRWNQAELRALGLRCLAMTVWSQPPPDVAVALAVSEAGRETGLREHVLSWAGRIAGDESLAGHQGFVIRILERAPEDLQPELFERLAYLGYGPDVPHDPATEARLWALLSRERSAEERALLRGLLWNAELERGGVVLPRLEAALSAGEFGEVEAWLAALPAHIERAHPQRAEALRRLRAGLEAAREGGD